MFPMFGALLESKQWLGCHLDLAWFADISWLILTLQSNALLSCTWLIPASVQMLRVYVVWLYVISLTMCAEV